ncbi:hypothetical protein FA13DRAFT_1792269 [Coprinellus micaceus]|uniref:Uncharacterized protein n=1 Tax=Coprinellus micaceus TaxID=71717 RepID=A0A4Y7T957_COPMI|nr:hypothetical protein FA13DRAFT_1792269 [Coprinellus micaceus]
MPLSSQKCSSLTAWMKWKRRIPENLGVTCMKDPSFPFRIVIASRPERTIQSFLSTEAACVTREIFLDDKYNPDSDIALFLMASFAKVRRRYRLPTLWPSEQDLQELVSNASGQFIYAATVIRFLQSGSHPNPRALLEALLSWKVQDKFALSAQWLWVIKNYREPAFFINQLLQDCDGQADYLLENLPSLLRIPPLEDQSSPYRFYHKSLHDFFKDGSRCGRELCHAFKSGDEFCVKHVLEIFINKSPSASLPKLQRMAFLRHFTLFMSNDLLVSPIREAVDTEWGPEALAMCDVQWWVRFASDLNRCDLIMEWFEAVHEHCPMGSPGVCLLHCKHWRANILRACKALGWDVPDAVALFREALYQDAEANGTLSVLYRPWGFDAYFQPPSKQSDLSSIDLPAMCTRYTADEEHQVTLDLVAAVYSRLPTDWMSRFLREVKGDKYAIWLGFIDIFEEIKQDLGMGGLDVPVQENWWPTRGDVDWDSRAQRPGWRGRRHSY